MSGYPKQGSAEQQMAAALTNEALGIRVHHVRDNRRAYDKKTADALLDEAGKRLLWSSSYRRHDTATTVEQVLHVMCKHVDVNEQAAAIAAWMNGEQA